MTANEDLLDATLRHQVGIRRLSAGQVRDALELLERADAELVDRLRRALRAGPPSLGTKRLADLLRSIRELRIEAIRELRKRFTQQATTLARLETGFEQRLILSALPVELTLNTVSVSTLRALVTEKPFAGGANSARTLNQWFESLALADQRRTVEAIQLGITQGESVDDIVRRVAGTRQARFRDGALAISRRNAAVVVRTAVNHISNAAREAVWLANLDIIAFSRWNATLDGRTSAICQARDGQLAPEGVDTIPPGQTALNPPGARPPAHPSCRSVMIAVLDPQGVSDRIGTRPFVRDPRTRRRRELDFRAQARGKVGARWANLNRTQRNAAVRRERDRWATENIGTVPADVTYQEWLSRQPAAFQDQVLGPSRGKLFRDGGVTLTQFVDRLGNELTLEQLAAL